MEQNHDYDEEQKLKAFARETVAFADEYAEARMAYAVAKLKIDGRLVDAYALNRADSKTGIKETLAIEKAYIQLTIENPEAKEEYGNMIKEEQNYKGLEQVLKARTHFVSLQQSLLKNKPA